MKAFNSGDSANMRDFIAAYTTEEALGLHGVEGWTEQITRIYEQTGGLRVQQVLAAEEYRVVVLMQAHQQSALHILEMAASEDYPHKVAALTHRAAGS
jgi:hypothetical protein